MKTAALLLAVALLSCNAEQAEPDPFANAQAVVDRIVAEHPDLVRLTVHGVPRGETESRILASNVAEKLGKVSDPEDLEAQKTGNMVVLREGDNLDVTAPIRDPEGKAVGATGITLRFSEGATEADLVEKAKAIAKELAAALYAR